MPRFSPGTPSVDFSVAIPGWQTTGADFEFWSDGYWTPTNPPPTPPPPYLAFEGAQHVELNAHEVSTLYQDTPVISNGARVGFRFAHRGRGGTDTLRLTITDWGADGAIGTGDDVVLFTRQYATNEIAWVQYTSAAEPPIIALGHRIRFAYASVASSSGDPTIGNFLDDAHFGSDVELTPCVTPPSGMVAWWPLDESTTPTAHEIVARRDATQRGGFNAGNFIAGEVNGAYRLNAPASPSKYAEVPNFSTFNFTASFTIDAWIRLTSHVVSGNARYIVSKASGNGFALTGYQFFVDDQDRLGFEMGTNNLSQNDNLHNLQTGASVLSLNTWYHVAVVVNRAVSPPRSRLYLNGGPVSLEFSHLNVASISNSSVLRIGSCTLVDCPFQGDIDEVEMFCRALESSEINSIYAAGPSGKCKISCKLPATVGFCPHDTTEPVTLTLCNNTASLQTFSWTVMDLPAGGSCSINGPTGFNPAAGSVSVPPFTCNPPSPPPQTIDITKPLDLALGTRSCYQARVTVPNVGAVSCSGAVVPELKDVLCCKPIGTTLRQIPVGVTQQVQFQCSNASGGSITFNYEVEEIPAANDPTYLVLNLNGLPAGTKVQQSTTIPATGSATIAILVRPLKPLRFVDHDIVLRGTFNASPPTALASLSIETESVDEEVCGRCDDANGCTTDTCDPTTSQCSYAAINCDDGQACTQDVCDPTGACVHTPTGPPPSEVDNSLHLARIGGTATLFTWNDASGAATSDVVRGRLSALPVGPGGGDEVCLDNDLAGPSTTDSTIPPVGGGLWYLVRGGSHCGSGPYGNQGLHGAPGPPRATTTCP